MNYDRSTSSAMNYYEELGVSSDATELEIRKAHRRLVKLMHPDAQPDRNLKMLAETQMRRLNSIVSTLLDSEQRRVYDEQLRQAQYHQQHPDNRGSWAGIPWWLASAIGAVALTLAAVWLWADHMGRGTGRNRLSVIQASRTLPPAAVRVAPDLGDLNHTNPVGASYTKSVPNSPVLLSESDQPRHIGDTASTVLPDPPASRELPVQRDVSKIPMAVSKQLDRPRDDSKPPSVEKRGQIRDPKPSRLHPTTSLSKTQEMNQHVLSAITSSKVVQISTPVTPARASPSPPPAPKKLFSIPKGTLVAQVIPPHKTTGPLPVPPGISVTQSHDYNSALSGSPLPSATPPRLVPSVTNSSANAGARDPLEGEWVYAPKEPERRRAGFYPPEFIDLKIFASGDPEDLKGEYNARYIVTDRPVSPDVSFQLASISRGSRRFNWQSNSGTRGTLSVDPIDDHTIRIDWHTTSAIRGPALTSGQATLVRRQ